MNTTGPIGQILNLPEDQIRKLSIKERWQLISILGYARRLRGKYHRKDVRDGCKHTAYRIWMKPQEFSCSVAAGLVIPDESIVIFNIQLLFPVKAKAMTGNSLTES